jgi:hypothetical protein
MRRFSRIAGTDTFFTFFGRKTTEILTHREIVSATGAGLKEGFAFSAPSPVLSKSAAILDFEGMTEHFLQCWPYR